MRKHGIGAVNYRRYLVTGIGSYSFPIPVTDYGKSTGTVHHHTQFDRIDSARCKAQRQTFY
jgi:hypothetical protein